MTSPCAGEHVASVERISHPSALLHSDGESELSSHAATWCQVWRHNNLVDHRIIFAFLVFFLSDVEMTKRAVRTTNQWSGLCIFIRWCLCYSQSDKSLVNRRGLIARRHLFVSVRRRATRTHVKEMQFDTRCNLTCGRRLEDINSKTSNHFLIASCSFLLVPLISPTYNIESIYQKTHISRLICSRCRRPHALMWSPGTASQQRTDFTEYQHVYMNSKGANRVQNGTARFGVSTCRQQRHAPIRSGCSQSGASILPLSSMSFTLTLANSMSYLTATINLLPGRPPACCFQPQHPPTHISTILARGPSQSGFISKTSDMPSSLWPTLSRSFPLTKEWPQGCYKEYET